MASVTAFCLLFSLLLLYRKAAAEVPSCFDTDKGSTTKWRDALVNYDRPKLLSASGNQLNQSRTSVCRVIEIPAGVRLHLIGAAWIPAQGVKAIHVHGLASTRDVVNVESELKCNLKDGEMLLAYTLRQPQCQRLPGIFGIPLGEGGYKALLLQVVVSSSESLQQSQSAGARLYFTRNLRPLSGVLRSLRAPRTTGARQFAVCEASDERQNVLDNERTPYNVSLGSVLMGPDGKDAWAAMWRISKGGAHEGQRVVKRFLEFFNYNVSDTAWEFLIPPEMLFLNDLVSITCRFHSNNADNHRCTVRLLVTFPTSSAMPPSFRCHAANDREVKIFSKRPPSLNQYREKALELGSDGEDGDNDKNSGGSGIEEDPVSLVDAHTRTAEEEKLSRFGSKNDDGDLQEQLVLKELSEMEQLSAAEMKAMSEIIREQRGNAATQKDSAVLENEKLEVTAADETLSERLTPQEQREMEEEIDILKQEVARQHLTEFVERERNAPSEMLEVMCAAIFEQTYSKTEVLVALSNEDNACKDTRRSTLRKLEQTYGTRLQLFCVKGEKGQSALYGHTPRNSPSVAAKLAEIFRNARGDIVALWSADAFYNSDRLQVQYDALVGPQGSDINAPTAWRMVDVSSEPAKFSVISRKPSLDESEDRGAGVLLSSLMMDFRKGRRLSSSLPSLAKAHHDQDAVYRLLDIALGAGLSFKFLDQQHSRVTLVKRVKSMKDFDEQLRNPNFLARVSPHPMDNELRDAMHTKFPSLFKPIEEVVNS